ncbi:MAG: DNA polymerase III subunit delta [Spirochaetales bacterium]|nr:DNA polymerase III subunit delta [Spirochaetales bacterium]
MNRTHLLLGPELGEKAVHLKKLKAALKKKSSQDPDVYKFYPDDDDIDKLLAAVKNESLFSSEKLVLVMKADELNQKQVKLFSAYCDQPSPDCEMVFITDQIRINQTLMNKIPKQNTVIFWELFENKKRDWLNAFFHKAGKKIEPDALELILEMVENNTLDLRRECGHLVAYYADRDTITEQLVEEFIFHSKEETMFSLFQRAALLQYREALEVFRKMIDSGSIQPAQLIGKLYWQFKKLTDYVRLSGQRFHHNEICEKLSIKGKRNQHLYQQAAAGFNSGNCRDIISLFAGYDRILKEARGRMGIIQAELFLYYLILKKGRESVLPLTLAFARK